MSKERLENWHVMNGCLWGNIYDSCRWEDGTAIVTSKILPMSMQVHTPAEGYQINTQNTTYLLGKPLNKGE